MGIHDACRQIAASKYFRHICFSLPFLLAAACSENATEPVAPDPDIAAVAALSLADAQLSGISSPILSKLGADKCIDSNSSGAVINSCDGSSDQNFTFDSDGSIVAANGACLAANPANYAARVQLRKCDGSRSQRWSATKAGEIRGVGGQCVGVAWNRPTDGTKLVLWTCNGTDSQKWNVGDVASANAKVSSALSVSGLSVASGKSYKVLAAGTKAGAVAYINRTYKLVSVPSVISGATFIRTANDDKFAKLGTSSFLSFDVNEAVDVYVAHGNDADLVRPTWLTGSFQNTGVKVTTDYPDLDFTLFRKSFKKGHVTLGSNTTKATDGSMYLVFIVPQGGSASDPVTDEPDSTPANPGTNDPQPPVEGPSIPGGSTGGKHAGIFVSPSGSSGASGSESSPMSLSAALSGGNGKIQAGDTVWLRKGTYSGNFKSSLSGSASAPVVVRQYPGERATINGTLTVDGRYTWYWGFEVANSSTSTIDIMGINSHCPGCRFINLVIHDHTGNGLGMWSEGPDQEAYGNVVYNNGFRAASGGGGYGHGIYAQNVSGAKRIVDNILFNQFGYGIHLYGSASAGLKNFTVDGNVVANSGQGDGADYLIGGGARVDNLTLTNNMSYISPGKRDNTLNLGYTWGPMNSGAVVTDNYFVGQLLITHWSNITFQRNTVLAPAGAAVYLELASGQSVPTGSSWNGNHYVKSSSKDLFSLIANSGGGGFDLGGWQQKTGFDKSSTFSSSMPTQTKVVVEPNRYEAGRANVIVYNWGHQGAVSVDLSKVLRSGDRYEVRNAQNFYGAPVASGTYGGGSVSIPITSTTPPRSIGGKSTSSTGTEFNAYVVVKTS